MPFQPGQSGNPAGRPRGARNKTTVLLEELIERDGEDLTRHFIEQAKTGDARALGCLMGMILPSARALPSRSTCRCSRKLRMRRSPLPR